MMTNDGLVAGRDRPEDPLKAVAAAAERLRLAMISPARAELNSLLHADLSYGHSSGRIDTRESLIADLLEQRSVFLRIEIKDESIRVGVPPVAIVRHTFYATTCDTGTPTEIALKILGIWVEHEGTWKMLARQAVRLPLA